MTINLSATKAYSLFYFSLMNQNSLYCCASASSCAWILLKYCTFLLFQQLGTFSLFAISFLKVILFNCARFGIFTTGSRHRRLISWYTSNTELSEISRSCQHYDTVPCLTSYTHSFFLFTNRGQNARLLQVPLMILVHSQSGHFQNARVS